MSTTKPTNYPALYTLIGVFFFWGFIAASNGVFIPFAKSYFNLSQFQSQLIDSAFYFAYYIGAFLLFILSVLGKKDLLNSWGFKSGIVYGLMLSVVGAFVMFPALASNQFAFILAALFIIALGFSLQQTAAQPFAISLGDESTGTHRLNLAGGINSFGTTIGPIIFALALLGTTKLDESKITGYFKNISESLNDTFIVKGNADDKNILSDENKIYVLDFNKKFNVGDTISSKSNSGLLFKVNKSEISTDSTSYTTEVQILDKVSKQEMDISNINDGTKFYKTTYIKGINLSTVQWLYVIVGLAFLAAALLFKFSKKLPDAKADATIENETKATGTISIITVILVLVLAMIFYQNTGENVDHTSKMGLYLLLIGIATLVFGLLFSNASAAKNANGWGAFKYPQLVLGMLGIFTYVGTEVTIQSNLGEYLKHLDFSNFLLTNTGVDYQGFTEMLKNNEVQGHWSGLTPMLISLYWGSLMIGRWAGAISAFNLSSSARKMALIIVPYVAFLIIITSNFIAGNSAENIKTILPYAGVILIQIAGFWIGQEKPAKTLMIFGILGMLAMFTGMFTTGSVSVFAFVSGGLFASVMWPSIFSLALQGLGKYTSQGSAFLIMMILGGAFIPPLQGKISDMFNITVSYWVPLVGFGYLTLFAILVKGILKKQNIDVDALASQASH